TRSGKRWRSCGARRRSWAPKPRKTSYALVGYREKVRERMSGVTIADVVPNSVELQPLLVDSPYGSKVAGSPDTAGDGNGHGHRPAAGPGATTRLLAAEYDVTVDGVDLGQSTVERARTATVAAGLADAVRFHVGDAERIPLPDNAF